MTRYVFYSAAVHAAGLALLILLPLASARKAPVYYGVDFLPKGAGFGPGAAGGASDAPEAGPAQPPPPPEPEAVPKKTDFVAPDPKKIQVPKKEVKAKQAPTQVAPAKKDAKPAPPAAAPGKESAKASGKSKGSLLGGGTGVEIGGFGAGGGGSGSGGGIGVKFPFAFYINIIYGRLWKNWDGKEETGKVCVAGFVIRRDGSVADIKLTEKSGDPSYDRQAERAVEVSAPFPPLPQDFPDPSLQVYVRFKFEE
ncbi:MAG: TonB family protein [Elusimicrobiota bacterium]